MWGLFVGAAAAVLAPIGPGALVPLKLAIASADSVGNDVYVAVVVDFGNGSSMTTVSKCVPVASNAHDADALAAAVGSANVAYSSSGLLCAIDNYPANGVQNCGQSVGNGEYDYWSYWHGASGTWVYASNGPAEQSVSNPSDDVEGLRFQTNEPASSSDPAPAVAPSYAQICNASTEVPPAQTSSAPATTTTTAGMSASPSVTPTTAKSSSGSGAVTTTTTAVSIRSKSTGAVSTTTTAVSGGTTTTPAPGASSGTAGGSHGSSDAHRIAAGAGAGAASHGGTGGGSANTLLPVVLIAVVVAALGGFALFRWRRRPAEE
jgi:hypothetical protein